MAIRKLNKKGVFFTIASILLLGLLFLFMSLRQEVSIKSDLPLVEHRIDRMNRYIVDLEDSYLPRIMANLGRAANCDLTKPTATTCVKNAILGGMMGALSNLKSVTESQLKFTVDIENPSVIDVQIHQDRVDLKMTVSYTIEEEGLARWDRDNIQITSSFSR